MRSSTLDLLTFSNATWMICFALGHFLFDEFLVFPRHYNVIVLLSCLHFFKFHPEEVKTSLFQLMFNLFSQLFIILPWFFPHFLVPGGNPPAQFCQGLRHAAGGKPMERVGMLSCYDYDISWCIYVSLFMEI